MRRPGYRSGNAEGAVSGRRKHHLRACRMSAYLGLALWAFLATPVDPAAAEEATTAPTCTGCSRPNVAKRAAKPHAPARGSARAAARPAAGINNEGAWAGISKGPCIVTWRWSIDVTNGVISGHKVTGNVSRTGQVRGTMVVFSKTYSFIGHFNGTAGSGTWKSVECSGGWTAAKS